MTTARIAYVNGRFLPLEEATIPIMDRGFLFGDGIYEVTAVIGERFVDNEPHLARLDRSLGAIGIRNPYPVEEWIALQSELVQRNGMKEGARLCSRRCLRNSRRGEPVSPRPSWSRMAS